MPFGEIRNGLEIMKTAASEVYAISRHLGGDSSVEDVEQALKGRAEAIRTLENTRTLLDTTQPGWKKTIESDSALAGLLREIRTIVARVAACDADVTRSMEGRMNAIRIKMRDLYGTSRAASAYTVQSWGGRRSAVTAPV